MTIQVTKLLKKLRNLIPAAISKCTFASKISHSFISLFFANGIIWQKASFLLLLFSCSLLKAEHSCKQDCFCDQWDDECGNACFYLEADYLYWRICQDGLDLAGKGEIYPGKIRTLEFDWSCGFRVKGGIHFCETWTLSAKYTWLRPKGKQKISGEEIFPTFLPLYVAGGWSTGTLETSEGQFTNAFGEINFDYNVIDFLCNKTFCGICFSWDILAGVQIASFKQKLHHEYSGQLINNIDQGTTLLEENLPFLLSGKQRWKYEGAGIKVGMEGEYQNDCGFFVHSQGDGAILYGKYRNRYDRTITELDTNSLIPGLITVFQEYYIISGRENFCDFASNIHFEFSIGWQNSSLGCLDLRLSAGWEMIYWIDLSQFRKGLTGQGASTDESPIGAFDFHFTGTNPTDKIGRNVGLQGLAVSLAIVF